jgi:F420H(2)-dependent quinone reductase
MNAMSTPERRPLRAWERAAERFASSKAGAWLYVNVFPPVDRRLHRWTGGRVHTGLTFPVGVLMVRGAKTGVMRETPLLYLQDGERLVLTASKGGSRRHPVWYHNLKANPDVEFRTRDGRVGRYRAREAQGAERDAMWPRVVALYAGYAAYQERTGGRTIPLLVLEPVTAGG